MEEARCVCAKAREGEKGARNTNLQKGSKGTTEWARPVRGGPREGRSKAQNTEDGLEEKEDERGKNVCGRQEIFTSRLSPFFIFTLHCLHSSSSVTTTITMLLVLFCLVLLFNSRSILLKSAAFYLMLSPAMKVSRQGTRKGTEKATGAGAGWGRSQAHGRDRYTSTQRRHDDSTTMIYNIHIPHMPHMRQMMT